MILTLLLVVGCGFGKQAQLDKYVASEKPNLPKILFDDVTVVDMATGSSEIIYYCETANLDAAAAAQAKKRMFNKAQRYAKTNQQQLKRLVDGKIKMTFIGRNGEGDELFRFSINPWEL